MGPVWKVKSLRAIVVGGYALTIADVTIPKLPWSVRQSLQLVTTVLENVPVLRRIRMHTPAICCDNLQSKDLVSHQTIL
jgi:hypothetical protein